MKQPNNQKPSESQGASQGIRSTDLLGSESSVTTNHDSEIEPQSQRSVQRMVRRLSQSDFESIAKSSVNMLDDQMGCGEEFYRCIKRFVPLFYRQLLDKEEEVVLSRI